MSVLVIEQFGWRVQYDLSGFFGIFLGLLVLFVLEEPERGQFDEEVVEKNEAPLLTQFKVAAEETFANPTGRNILIGGAIRNIGAFCIGLYKPLYFAKVYPEFID